jgi:mycoredoxin
MVWPRKERQNRGVVRIYWRPGCIFCQRLRLALWFRRLPAEWINIWRNPDDAAFVRSVAGGNETVPTVVIDGQAFVNPPPRAVVAAARRLR